MITNEQVNVAIEVIKQSERHNVQACLDEFKKIGQHTITPEVFVRQLLENYEQSKWIEFDINNESTHPKDNQLCSVVYHTGQVCTDKWSVMPKSWVYASCPNYVTHWQPLPEFKE